MTTVDPHVAGAGVTAAAGERADGIFAALADWLTTSDHKKVGRLFVATSLLVLAGAMTIGALLGFERIEASNNFLDDGVIPQLFALHRLLLTFGVLIPIGLGLAVAIVPLQLGARSLAFPRVAALGFWTWLSALVVTTIAVAANGGPGGGDPDMVDLYLTGHVLVVLGLVAASAAVATTVLTTRAPGMNMRRVPLFAWSALVGTLGMVLALPVLASTLVLLAVDHRYGRVTFGGNTGISEWTRVASSQPATFLYAVPVLGILLDTLATATRKRLPLRGMGLAGIGLAGTAFVAGVAQVDAGIRRNVVDASFSTAMRDIVPYAVLNLLPLLGIVVVLLVTLNALRGRPRPISPLVFAVVALTALLAAAVANALYHIGDFRLAGTTFEEGMWIAVCYGAAIAAIGGLVFWGPKLWGRSIPDAQVLPLALLGMIGLDLAAGSYLIAGFAKQPANAMSFDYSGPQNLWNGLAAAGHVVSLVMLLAFVGMALRSFTAGPPAGDDPWDGQTLEWATSSPAPADNFAEVHSVASAEPLLDLKPARSSEGAA